MISNIDSSYEELYNKYPILLMVACIKCLENWLHTWKYSEYHRFHLLECNSVSRKQIITHPHFSSLFRLPKSTQRVCAPANAIFLNCEDEDSIANVQVGIKRSQLANEWKRILRINEAFVAVDDESNISFSTGYLINRGT